MKSLLINYKPYMNWCIHRFEQNFEKILVDGVGFVNWDYIGGKSVVVDSNFHKIQIGELVIGTNS